VFLDQLAFLERNFINEGIGTGAVPRIQNADSLFKRVGCRCDS